MKNKIERIKNLLEELMYRFRGILCYGKFKKRGHLKVGKRVRFVCRNFEIISNGALTLY